MENPEPDQIVTVHVARELLTQMRQGWSPPVEVMITGSEVTGWDMIARTHSCSPVTASHEDNPLTDRMTMALQLVADGLSHRQAAKILGISHTAINARLEDARQKLSATSTAHAITLAIRAHILT